jgi:16S rRNA C967 or C1407 C5-methylase (RsmB/RsmF family)
MPSFDSLPGHLFYPQNLPSILAVEELDLHPGMTVLDMCAAPGGKTSHIGAKMRNQGFLLAIDKSRKKVDALNRTLSSLRITCARTIVDDSARLCSFEISGDCPPENYEPGRLLKHGTFDRILLDPPCSGFGKRPLIVTDNFAPNLRGFAEYQKRLIRVASILLKSGGILVYSTCTMSLEENEGVIGYAIRSLPLKLEAVKNHKHGSEGVNFGGLTQEECYLTRRFWPAGPDDSVAFFYAKLRKI